MEQSLKTCKTCNAEKPESKFNKNNRSCRACVRHGCNQRLKIKRPEYLMFERAKLRAARGGIDFNITQDDIVIPEFCPYLNIKIIPGDCRNGASPSLDRIDNSKGYIKGNIEVISSRANISKNSLSINELKTFARNVLKRHHEFLT